MPLFKFRIYWEDDDNIYRDIIIKKGQTFLQFKETIMQAFEFKKPAPSSFFESNDKWTFGREISSEILVNKKESSILSMLKTPVSALIEKPDQKFLFVYQSDKTWTFLIVLIGITLEESHKLTYPHISKSEGIAPLQTNLHGVANERLMEIEEKYDLNKEDMDEQGFGSDDDEEDDDNQSEDRESDENMIF